MMVLEMTGCESAVRLILGLAGSSSCSPVRCVLMSAVCWFASGRDCC